MALHTNGFKSSCPIRTTRINCYKALKKKVLKCLLDFSRYEFGFTTYPNADNIQYKKTKAQKKEKRDQEEGIMIRRLVYKWTLTYIPSSLPPKKKALIQPPFIIHHLSSIIHHSSFMIYNYIHSHTSTSKSTSDSKTNHKLSVYTFPKFINI